MACDGIIKCCLNCEHGIDYGGNVVDCIVHFSAKWPLDYCARHSDNTNAKPIDVDKLNRDKGAMGDG